MQVRRVPGEGTKQLELFLNGLKTDKVGKVGWFEGNVYPDKNSTPVAYAAAINEYGVAGKIPARPFFRPTIRAQQNNWRAIAESEARKMVKGETTAENALFIIGARAKQDVFKTASQIFDPPLSPITIEIRLRKRGIKKAKTISQKYALDPANRSALSTTEARSLGNLYKPLFDTRQMFNTIINVVEPE
jgi:hypothetical protein